MPKMQHLDEMFRSTVTSRRTFLKVGAGAALATAGLTTSTRADATRPIVYAHAAWSDALAITFVGAKLIEDHFGYKVQPLQADVAVIYASLQSGKADLYSNSYMQGLGPLKGDYRGGQADYVKRVAKSIEVVGVSEGPMTQGLAVPKYVTIDSIDELNANADKFPAGIVGIDPGSGLMQSADKTVKAYDLEPKLVAGSEAAMEAAFQTRVLPQGMDRGHHMGTTADVEQVRDEIPEGSEKDHDGRAVPLFPRRQQGLQIQLREGS